MVVGVLSLLQCMVRQLRRIQKLQILDFTRLKLVCGSGWWRTIGLLLVQSILFNPLADDTEPEKSDIAGPSGGPHPVHS